MRYVYLPPAGEQPLVRRRDEEITEARAAAAIGDRVLAGFDVVQRSGLDRDGVWFQLIYFQSEISGNVWAIYF